MVYRTQYFSAFSAVYAEIMQSYFCSAFFSSFRKIWIGSYLVMLAFCFIVNQCFGVYYKMLF